MIFIDTEQISEVLTYKACIGVMRDAMIRLSSGQTKHMLRNILPVSDATMFGIMAGTMGPGAPYGSKLISVTPVRADMRTPSHQGAVVLFDPVTNAVACQADAGMITAIRTASASALASDALARSDARVLAILGTGEQAHHHALALREVRQLSEIRIWGRSLHKAGELATRLRQETGLSVVACEHVRQATYDADIICTVTASSEPVLTAQDVKPGVHINLVGSSYDGPREADDELITLSRLFADSSESVLAQGAEFRHAISRGRVTEAHLSGEIGDVLSGNLKGRTSPSDVTIYNSLGHIIQDIAATAYIFDRLKEQA